MTTANFTSKSKRLSRTLHYRFLCLRLSNGERAYYVQVRLGKEKSMGQLPRQDRKQAFELYQMIQCGKVTPCTLKDILEDMK